MFIYFLLHSLGLFPTNFAAQPISPKETNREHHVTKLNKKCKQTQVLAQWFRESWVIKWQSQYQKMFWFQQMMKSYTEYWGSRMEGADEYTELWRHPFISFSVFISLSLSLCKSSWQNLQNNEKRIFWSENEMKLGIWIERRANKRFFQSVSTN